MREVLRSVTVVAGRSTGPSQFASALRRRGDQRPVDIARSLRASYPGLSARKALRLARGWTQEQAAAEWALQFGQPKAAKQFSYWETWPHSGHPPSLDTLDRLAQLYQCSAADLLADLPDYGITGVDPMPTPPDRTRVGRTDVEMVRTVTGSLAGAENALGGEVVTSAGLGQLQWASALLGAHSAPDVRRDLYESVGNLAGVVGFAAFDAGDLISAERCFGSALSCADEARSWTLRTCTLADLARVHEQAGDVDAALSAIEFAQVRSDRLPATARAMLCVRHARYLASVGRSFEALGEIEAGDSWFALREPAGDPPWLGYYDRAEHDGSVGRALMSAATVTGHLAEVRARLESAVRLQNDAYPRSLAFSRLRLACLLVTSGDPDEGAHIGDDALEGAMLLRSRRVTAEFGALLDALAPRAAVPAVHRLRQRVRAHLNELSGLAMESADG